MKKNVFIDCGTNLGQGLLEFHMMLNILNSPEWEIHSFEANPDIDLNFPVVDNLSYHKKAVWVKETTIGFMMARRGQPYDDPLGWGNSSAAGELTRLGNHLQIDEIDNPNITEALEKVVQVPAINFSEYLKTFQTSEYGRIVVKMDVEGAEYKIYIFIDDDLTWEEDSDLAKNIADVLDRWKPVAGCFPEFDAWHMTSRPGPLGEVSCIAGFDLNNHIFSASAADALFPAVYHGSGRSFWHAQFFVYKLCPEKHLSLDSLPISNSRNLGAAQDTVEAREGLRPYFVMGPDMNIKYSEHMSDKTFLNWDHGVITAENFHASREFTPSKEELLFTSETLSRIYDMTNSDYLLRKPLRADIKYQVRGLR
jgi:hypothetical protein